jgi:phospholipase C
MNSRRDFLKAAALLAAGGAAIPASIRKAFAIDPTPGSTYLDAEHVVILMQENRSFDHCYGMLQGVRGFNDPRAVRLPNGNPVWLQSTRAGDTYAPFRLNIKDTKSTWMSSLPHSWTDQVDALNRGKNDGWLDAKKSGNKQYATMPLTMGFYDRQDIPFYYALADAFTVCDQNFCSSLTGTTPNRLYLWTGTIREKPSITAKANVRNSDVDYGSEASWKTFPERLEENGISWRVYQNEISLESGFKGEEDDWLSNFTDNPLEWFKQYHVRFSATHRKYLAELEKNLPAEIARIEALSTPLTEAQKKDLAKKRAALETARADLKIWNEANFEKLSAFEKNLHQKAFSTNEGDPQYRKLAKMRYADGGKQREMEVPAGDTLHRFREDVKQGKLPAVSWIVAPSKFSDHPGSPWYGAWYLSETLDILTQNPEVWKKTIFILCYDENDGYFDHIPPFVPPAHNQPDTGKVSAGIDTSVEFVTKEQEGERGRTGPIGLGFRVPLVIASPWSRGGAVCSQVFDHTSILQLLEKVLSHKTGKPIRETNISAWRRTVCGDLSSVFKPFNGEAFPLPKPVEREPFFGSIHSAQFKELPSGFKKFTPEEIAAVRANPRQSNLLLPQEKGVRPSRALPYELSVDGAVSADGKKFVVQFAAGRELFGANSAGAPFHVYAPGKTKKGDGWEIGRTWAYAAAAGDKIVDEWPLELFEGGRYHLCVHGPNGFFREFQGSAEAPSLEVSFGKGSLTAVGLRIANRRAGAPISIVVEDLSYGSKALTAKLGGAGKAEAAASLALDLTKSFGWYNFAIRVPEFPGFEQRYAGRIETGRESVSDPSFDRA